MLHTFGTIVNTDGKVRALVESPQKVLPKRHQVWVICGER
eukprot:XP_001708420.1 Hypothetical protein GL50803_37482 [Giardia lamblia ATCC 50803]